MRFIDRFHMKSNVTILKKDRNGCVVDKRESHNVVTNTGRQWLRDTIACAAYPAGHATSGAGMNLAGSALDDTAGGGTDYFALDGKTYRPRYIGVGVGGVLQSILARGAQIEESSVVTLEKAVKITNSSWLKQVLPTDDTGNSELFPTDYSIRYRAILEYDDVSFAGQLYSLGTDVPISEAMLFTSEATPDDEPDGRGSIAYNIFTPISVTPNFYLELAWELRF